MRKYENFYIFFKKKKKLFYFIKSDFKIIFTINFNVVFKYFKKRSNLNPILL